MLTGVVGAIAGYGGSFIVTPAYRATVVVMPLSQEGAFGGNVGDVLGQLGGLASLAGVNFSAGTSQNEAIEVLRSRKLVDDFIAERELLPTLFSVLWNPSTGAWDVNDPEEIPTPEDAFRLFDGAVRSISQDRGTGVVTLSVTWTDRQQAADWANGLIVRANRELRERAIREARLSIEYLNRELEKTSSVEVEKAIFGLIEEQIKSMTLANAREEYSFRVIDPAVIPDADHTVRPQRMVFAVVGLFAFAGVMSLVLWRLSERKRENVDPA